MDVTLYPAALDGSIEVMPSKSVAHRLLICAALSREPSRIRCARTSDDLDATAACLNAMGADISWHDGVYTIRPIQTPAQDAVLPCRESGSTLRFLLPVCGALGIRGCFRMEGRLPQRPMTPLTDALTAHGMQLSQDGKFLHFSQQLRGGEFAIAGNVSSQYLTGLLFALPLLPEGGCIRLTTPLESRPYLDLTLDALATCGVSVSEDLAVCGGQRPQLPQELTVEGDWSDAAAFLAAGAIGGRVRVCGLSADSRQGDRAMLEHLRAFGANIERSDGITVSRAPLRGITADVSETPDLVPVLAALAAYAEGETRITGAARLRFKESDRLRAVHDLLACLGGDVTELPDGLIIRGTPLHGGASDVCGDHRIAMAAALCALRADSPVEIRGAQCTDKSHPNFWTDFLSLRKEP